MRRTPSSEQARATFSKSSLGRSLSDLPERTSRARYNRRISRLGTTTSRNRLSWGEKRWKTAMPSKVSWFPTTRTSRSSDSTKRGSPPR
jgi:hypothetical protein